MPDTTDPYHYENLFYRTCDPTRIGKLIAHFRLYEQILAVPGAIVECGVFKGNSLFRWASFRALFEAHAGREIIAFDTFGEFPPAQRADDRAVLQGFLEVAGNMSAPIEDIQGVLEQKGCAADVDLVAGDLVSGLAPFLERRPRLGVALLHIDVDLFEPTRAALEQLGPRISSGGVCVLDDYGIFPGATEAIDAYCGRQGLQIERLPYVRAPAYFVMP
jgi:hypothetical protein